VAVDVSPQRTRLGARLRELRAVRFRSGSALARELGWHQTKVSKIELGRQLPSSDELAAWIEVVGAAAEDLQELAGLLAAARLDYREWGEAWRTPGRIVAIQDDIAALDARATRIAEYQPAMVPGIVQTPAYAREMLSAAGGPMLLGAKPSSMEERIAAQVRRQEVLYTPGKTIQVVLGEGALRTRFGDASTLAGQRDRLVTLAALANVEIAVLPFDRPCPVLPLAGFSVLDSEVVWLESLTGEQRIDDPDQVSAYVRAFDAALDAAATGDEAIDLIRRIS
jgi:transcriptional regulator with XRE-family HTH domain